MDKNYVRLLLDDTIVVIENYNDYLFFTEIMYGFGFTTNESLKSELDFIMTQTNSRYNLLYFALEQDSIKMVPETEFTTRVIGSGAGYLGFSEKKFEAYKSFMKQNNYKETDKFLRKSISLKSEDIFHITPFGIFELMKYVMYMSNIEYTQFKPIRNDIGFLNVFSLTYRKLNDKIKTDIDINKDFNQFVGFTSQLTMFDELVDMVGNTIAPFRSNGGN